MSGTKPFFSIVMPTRNRSKLLGLAIQSVVNQTFEDFEIIISDNNSHDNTPEIARSFNDKRIKYFRSDISLSLGDSWEFALSHANGQYVSFLADDDAYVQTMLEKGKKILDEENTQLVAFPICRYYHTGDIEFGRKMEGNTLAIDKFTNNLKKHNTKDIAKQIYQLWHLNSGYPSSVNFGPALVNAFYDPSIFQKIKKVRPNYFHSTPSDLYMSVAICFILESYFTLDTPMYVWSNWAENTTASISKKGEKIKDHYKNLLDRETLSNTPVKFPLPYNCGVHTLIKAKNDFNYFDEGTEITWNKYYIELYENLMYLKGVGIDINDELNDFYSALEKEPKDIKTEVNAKLKEIKFRVKQFVRQFPSTILFLKRFRTDKSYKNLIVANGDEEGFTDIIGATKYIQKLFTDGFEK